jgi:hypothetical protein
MVSHNNPGRGNMRITLVHVSIPSSHKYLRKALERVVTMNESYDGEANPEMLFLQLSAAFHHEKPGHLLYVGIDEHDEIVAHGFAALEYYYGEPVVTCHQLWRNALAAKFEPGQLEKALDSIANWGASHGATKMRTFAANEKVVKIAERYGWRKTERVMMERDIPKE